MEKTTKLYIAYGSNLNLGQMARRCPTAKVKGTAMLKGWQLTFKGVATIDKNADAETPVGVWEIQPSDEAALDRYEGYPHLYRKEETEIEVRGEKLKAMVYIMNTGTPSLPSQGYFETISEGYEDVGLDKTYLNEALEDTVEKMKIKKST